VLRDIAAAMKEFNNSTRYLELSQLEMTRENAKWRERIRRVHARHEENTLSHFEALYSTIDNSNNDK
jgi:hypothetical protein